MRSLLNFIYRFHYFIIFILIESFALFLVIQYNNFHRASFLNSSSQLSGLVYKQLHGVTQYLNLKNKNLVLTRELSEYKANSKKAYKKNKISLLQVYDSVYVQHYEYIPCQVINNSVNKQNNYLTLNAGNVQGIHSQMAVLSPEGVVGVVKETSENFASVISILNQNLRVSGMLKRTGYYGSLNWDGLDYRYANLYDLPNHISIIKGDTVITSGYSTMFPKGELIGVVEEIDDVEGSEFVKIRVKLAVDFKNVSNVIVVRNLLKEEQLKLESEASHD